MTSELYTIVVCTLLGAQAVRALWSSLKKERVMVREGGEPLPTSVWVFLAIEVACAPLFGGIAISIYVHLLHIPLTNPAILTLLTLVVYYLSVVLSRFISVLVATIFRLHLARKYAKQIKGKDEQELAQHLRSQMGKRTE